jgi:hypothetical protein
MRALPPSSAKVHLSLISCFLIASLLGAAGASVLAAAQESSPSIVAARRPLITQAIDEARLTVLKGNTHLLARPQFDLGTAPATLPMERMLLVLKRSDEQETALRKLIDDQQDKNSANYHKWLTPEQFGAQFGPTDADLQTVTSWLQSHGFQVGSTKGRTVLEFSGSASQVQEAFHTSIHKYIVNGDQHWANASDPSIPAALTPSVAGISSLNNFPRKPMSRILGAFSGDKTTGQIHPVTPVYTLPTGCVENNSSSNPCFYGVSPYDFATIYDVLPLWNSGINGTGQTIAIVGETNINIQDVRDFRNLFGLPVNDPQIILNGPDPGIIGDETESDLDLQWSGAVAPNATIKFVTSASTETTAGTDLSAVYIIENNVAPVMSESYGFCELGLGNAGNQFFNALWQQAAAQGITVFISSGDNGSAGCDDFNAQSPAPALYGLQVSGYASTPYNVAVGGTDFNDFLNPSTYWNLTNNTQQASAKGYIPEVPWNSTCTSPVFGQIGFSSNAETNCNDPNIVPNFDVPLGGSGGTSGCTTSDGQHPSSCSGGYARPSWQTGTGVPNDTKRHIPDVSLFASSGFLGNFYMICEADQTPGPCSLAPNYYFLGIGGTSASSPAFAGIMALVNQQMAQTTGNPNERQGNANYVLYKLAVQQPTVFHDITSGNITMPCATGSPNCTTSVSGHLYGVSTGYNTATGYDMATGLGSVDVDKLVTKWNTVTLLPSVTTLSSLTPVSLTHGQAVTFTVSVAPKSGTGPAPLGLISLQGGPTNSTADIQGFNLTNGAVTGTTEMLPGGTYQVTAHYPGDSTYAASDSSPFSVTVNKENSQPQVSLMTFDTSGHIVNASTNTAVYGSPYVLRAYVANAGGHLCAPIAASNPTPCPTGTVSLTNNGTTLDAGTYTLNGYGYAEDLAVQLPGGSDSVKASYSGDDSFNGSSSTAALTISKAAAGINPPNVPQAWVGSGFDANAIVQSLSNGAPPTGTITFYVNGTAVTGTTTYQSGNQIGPPAVAWLTAGFASSASALPTAGSYTITASYSGDGNYSGDTSSGTQINVQYPPLYPALTPYTQNVDIGATASISVLFESNNKTVYPTGTVTFTNGYGGGVLAGPVSCTNATNPYGQYSCQASASFAVTTAITVIAHYSGDTNYPAANGSAVVNVNDFAIGLDSTSTVTVPQGQSKAAQVDVSLLGAFNGIVSNFACSGLPAETTCSFNPTQVTVSQVTGGGTTALTIATTPLGRSRMRRAAEDRRPLWWVSVSGLLVGICLIVTPSSRRRFPLIPMALVMALLLPSCGGGNGSGGGGGNNPTPHISSLSPTQVAAGSTGQTLTINGSGFISTSSVSYNNLSHVASFVSATQMTMALSANDVASAGSYPVEVTNPSPGGGTSESSNLSVVTGTPTGSFQVTVTASSGSLTHSTTFTLVVQ